MGLSITDKFLIDANGQSINYSYDADVDGIYFAEGEIAASSSQITQCNVIDKIIDDVIALNEKAVTDTYDPTSSAAMSGKAIANALSTVSADVDGTTIVKGTDGKLGLDPTLATKLSTLPDNLITGTGTADKLAVFTDTDEIGASVSITKSTDTLSNDDDSILTTKAVKNLFGDSFTETSGKYELANGVVTADKLDATLRSGIVIGAVAPLTVNASNQVELTGKVDGAHIDDKAIKASHLADDFTLSGEKLTDATVTEAKLASTFSLDGSKIKDATITEDKLASGFTLDGSKITNATITADKLTSDFKLDGSKITDKTVTETQLADKAVSTAKIADNAVTETLLANNSVTSTKLADDSVVEAKLADNAVTEDKIKDSAVTSAKLADNAVTTAKIADDAIDKTKIAADVAGDGLAQNVDGSLEVSVDGSTIEISSDKLQIKNSGVTTAKIADSNVTTAKVADAAITEDKLADDAVTTDKIADAAITKDKLDSSLENVTLFTTDVPTAGALEVKTSTTSDGAGGTITTKTLGVKESGITATELAANAVTHPKIADNAVQANNIKNGEVSAVKLADDAKLNTKIFFDNTTLDPDKTYATGDTTKDVKIILKNQSDPADEIASGFIPRASDSFAGTVVLESNIVENTTGEVESTNPVTAHAIGTYISNKLGDLAGALIYKGAITSTANLPDGSAGNEFAAGDTYVLSADVLDTDGVTVLYPGGAMFIANKNSADVAVGDTNVWQAVSPTSKVDVPSTPPGLTQTEDKVIATVGGKLIKAHIDIEEESIKINQLEEDVQTVINMAAMLIEIKEPGFYLVDPDLNTGVGATTPIVYGVRVANE